MPNNHQYIDKNGRVAKAGDSIVVTSGHWIANYFAEATPEGGLKFIRYDGNGRVSLKVWTGRDEEIVGPDEDKQRTEEARQLAAEVLELHKQHRMCGRLRHEDTCAVHSYSGRANTCNCTPTVISCTMCDLARKVLGVAEPKRDLETSA